VFDFFFLVEKTGFIVKGLIVIITTI
jgi:hypothetical protein